MKTYRLLAVLVLFMGLFAASSALGAETKVFGFKARTWDAIASGTHQLNGEYDVAVSDGKCEATYTLDGKLYLVGADAGAELCRMVGIDPDNRKYRNPPHKVGQEWAQTHSFGLRGRTFRRTVTYHVTEEKRTPTGHVLFKIEGDARLSSAVGAYDQKWVYFYNEETGIIVKWFHDSAVGDRGAKIEIELNENNK